MDVQTLASIVRARIQMHLTTPDVQASVQELNAHMQSLLDREVDSASIAELLIVILAGACKQGSKSDIVAIRKMCQQFVRCRADVDGARFLGDQLALLGTSCRLRGSDSKEVH